MYIIYGDMGYQYRGLLSLFSLYVNSHCVNHLGHYDVTRGSAAVSSG